VEAKGIKFDFDSYNGLVAEALNPEPKSPTEATAINEDDTGGVKGSIQSLSSKGKTKEKRIT